MQNFLSHTLDKQIPALISGTTEYIRWQWLDHGVVTVEPKEQNESLDHVLLSAGVHGNETAPIELLDQLLADLYSGELKLGVRLMLMLGNPEAMIKGERYNKIDLNRLFSHHHKDYQPCTETRRAERLEQLTFQFFESAPGQKLHFDLHTAIRGSFHTRFALLPYKEEGQYSRQMFDWLSSADVEAVVLNQAPSATFSYYSSECCQADSCTLELGKAKPFGQNDLSQFQAIDHGLRQLVRSGINRPIVATTEIKVYQVSQQLTKLTEEFELNFSDSVKNFTAFKQNAVLATDGDTIYRVKQVKEWVLFPNANVRPGLRAGLMLVQVEPSTLFN